MAKDNMSKFVAWVEGEIAALTERADPIGPRRVGYDDADRYGLWCLLTNHRDRLKVVRGHLLAIQKDRAERPILRPTAKGGDRG